MSRHASGIELPDGSRIDRDHKTEKGRRVPVGSWRWVVYDPDRRPARKRVNLRTKDKATAMRKALDLVRQWSLGTFDPWNAAGTPGSSLPYADAVKAYLAERARTAAPSTVETDRGTLSRLGAELPAGTALRHIESRHVETVVNARKRPPKGPDGKRRGPGPEARPETKSRRRATLQHFFAWAAEEGYAETNPAAGVRLPKMTGRRREHLTEDEVNAVLRASSAADVLASARGVSGRRGWVADWVTFAVGTGLRPGEQRKLTWGAVRLAERAIEVGVRHRVKTKNSRRRVPLAGDALEVIRRLHAERTTEADGPVFTGANGGPVSKGYITKRLKLLAERAGIEKEVCAYSLRHSYGTRMAAAGVPLLDLSRIMGTSLRMIEKHYAHYDPARGASHVERVFGTVVIAGSADPTPKVGHNSDKTMPSPA